MEATGDKHCTMMRRTLYNDASFKVPLIIDNASARMLEGYGSCLVWVYVCNVRNVPRFDESLCSKTTVWCVARQPSGTLCV